MSPTVLGEPLSAATPAEASPPPPTWDVPRILFAVVGIGGLIAASFWVVRPFLGAVVWATMIVVATWPAMRAVQARLWGKRGLAVAVMTVTMLAVLVAPLTVSVIVIIDRADDVVAWSRTVVGRPLPALPGWLAGLPIVGTKLATEWQKLTSATSEELAALIAPHLRELARWLISQAGSVGVLLLQFLLTVAVSAILYARGELVTSGALAFAYRLAGTNGTRAVLLSGGAIRAVALGIVVTALAQALIGGAGLAVTGVPHVLLLTCIMIMLGIAQIGPAPVVLGAVIWLYANGQTIWGTVMLGWALVTMSMDNVLRPLLIRKGADLPLLLIIAGVIGGLIAFGLVGLFVGPVVLAVAYTLLVAWVREVDPPGARG